MMSLKVGLILLCLTLAEASPKTKAWGTDGGLNLSKECVEENWSLIKEQQTKSSHNLLTCHFRAIIKELILIPKDSLKPDVVLFKDLLGLTKDLWECRHLKANIKTCIFQKAVDAFKKAVSLIKILITYDTWYIRLRNNIEECIGLGQSDYQRFVEILKNKSVKCQ